MGKDKKDKRKLIVPERVIYSSNIVPKDKSESFKRFVKKLVASKNISCYNMNMEISELGPREELSTLFQVIGGNMSFHFKIRYIMESSKVDIGYETILVYTQWVPKLAKKANEKQISNVLIPYIIKAFSKSIELKVKKPKEKKPEDKEKKEKKEKKPKEEKEKKPKDPLKLLKLQFVEGEISEEEYFRKKKILEE
jgi:hypothetical protein